MADKNQPEEATAWPKEGTPLVGDVQAPGFLAVTEEALDMIVQRLVPALTPHKIVLFGSYSYPFTSESPGVQAGDG
jgi:hypothetical protein